LMRVDGFRTYFFDFPTKIAVFYRFLSALVHTLTILRTLRAAMPANTG
jgi:hypothetical protein